MWIGFFLKLSSNILYLLTPHYTSTEPARNREIGFCLEKNILNPYIQRVYLFLEQDEGPDLTNFPAALREKVIPVPLGRRPFFSDFFGFANTLDGAALKIVANSDVYFDDTLELAEGCLSKYDVLALTRWDLKGEGSLTFYNSYKSQDCWIFRKQIPPVTGQFYIGYPGCDNRLLYEFRQQGLTYYNPSFSIKAIHVHESQFRGYQKRTGDKRVPPPYAYALPAFCSGIPAFADRSLQAAFAEGRYRYFKSLSSNTLPGKDAGLMQRALAFFASKYWAAVYRRTARAT